MKKIIICLYFSLTSLVAFASDYCVGSTITYTSSTPPSCSSMTVNAWDWSTSNGVIVSSTSNSITIQWTSAGSVYIRRTFTGFCFGQTTTGSLANYSDNINLNNAPTPATPNVTYYCNFATLDFNGSAPSGYSWYWQTSADGQDTSNGAASWSVGSPTTYFLRALGNCGWSAAASVSTASGWLSTPAMPSLSQPPACSTMGGTTVTFNSNNASDRWYTSSSGGTLVNTGNSYTVNKSDANTYWVEAVGAGGCVSARSSISVSTRSCTLVCKDAISNYSDTGSVGCGPITSYSWVVTGGTKVVGSESLTNVSVKWDGTGVGTIVRNITYFCFNAYTNATTLNQAVYINTAPPVPATPTVTAYSCGSATLAFNGSPPAGDPASNTVTWFWQTASDAHDETNSVSSWSVYSPTTYFLVAKNSCGWSGAASVSTASGWKYVPPSPGISQDVACISQGGSTVTFHSQNTTDKWYSVASGGNPVNIGDSFVVSKTDNATYYVEAVTAAACVSTSRSQIQVYLQSCAPVCKDQTVNYSATASIGVGAVTGRSWIVTNGIKVVGSEVTNSSGTSVSVVWNGEGTGRIQNKITYRLAGDPPADPDRVAYTFDQYVYTNIIPSVPPAPSVSYDCQVALLTFNGTPPSNTDWFWQSSNTSQDDASSQSPRTVYEPSTYFLRARNICGWSPVTSLSTVSGWLTCELQPRVAKIAVTSPGFTSEESIIITDSDNNDAQIEYLDGLGRASQTVSVKGSPTGHDIIQPSAYDIVGRESKKFLPFVSGNSTGQFVEDPTGMSSTYISSPQYTFYNSATDKVADDAKPFAETIFESSMLNRVSRQGAPGTDWQPDPVGGVDHSIKQAYTVNGSEQVYQFVYDGNTGLVALADGPGRFISPGQLSSKITTDEHQNQVIEYVNAKGQTICKKVQYDTVGTDRQFASTYYIYDDMDNLVVVLPPEGLKELLLGN